MSLINEMLKNIEKRNGSNPSHYSTKNPTGEEDSAMPLMILIGAVVVCIIIILSVGVHYYEQYRAHHIAHVTQQIQAPPPATEKATTPNQTADTTIPAHSITVTHLHIDDLPKQTTVALDLTDTANFTSQADLANHTETITLDNTWLDTKNLCKELGKPSDCLANNDIPLPVNTVSIQSIHIKQNDGKQLILFFQLSDAAVMHDAHLKDKVLTLIFSTDSKDAAAPDNADPSILKSSAPLPMPSDLDGSAPSDNESTILQPATEPEQKMLTKYDQVDTYILLKQFDKAQAIVKQFTPHEQTSTSGLMLQARLQLAMGNNVQALSILNRYPFNNKTPTPEFYALYAATLEFNGKHAEAATIYKNLVKQSPENPTWLLGYGISAMNDHQYELAKSIFQTLVDIRELNPEISNYAEQQIEKINISNQ